MLDSLSRHSGMDLTVRAKGDLHVDDHHTVEDVGLCLGEAIRKALGDKKGIKRFGWALCPMDEALARAEEKAKAEAEVRTRTEVELDAEREARTKAQQEAMSYSETLAAVEERARIQADELAKTQRSLQAEAKARTESQEQISSLTDQLAELKSETAEQIAATKYEAAKTVSEIKSELEQKTRECLEAKAHQKQRYQQWQWRLQYLLLLYNLQSIGQSSCDLMSLPAPEFQVFYVCFGKPHLFFYVSIIPTIL